MCTSVDSRSAASGHPVALAVLDLDPDAGRLALLGVDEHHVGDVNRPFFLDHAAHLLGALRACDLLRALVALDDSGPLDVQPVLRRLDPKHAAALAPVLTTDHDHLVTRLDPC